MINPPDVDEFNPYVDNDEPDADECFACGALGFFGAAFCPDCIEKEGL